MARSLAKHETVVNENPLEPGRNYNSLTKLSKTLHRRFALSRFEGFVRIGVDHDRCCAALDPQLGVSAQFLSIRSPIGAGREEPTMPVKVKQGDLDLLQHRASKELLESKIPARLAYIWTDGTPRVIPIWFHWNGREVIMASPPKAPKLKALARNPKVSLTIDDNVFPHKVLLIRGSARLETVDGVVPEYATAAERYFGRDQGQAWVEQLRTLISSMVRITITPEWVGLLDFQTRFPSALSS